MGRIVPRARPVGRRHLSVPARTVGDVPLDHLELDYSRTARRLGWDSVPPSAVRALEVGLAGRVVEAGAPVGSGFGGQYAGPVRLHDGRRVFVKAAPPWIEFQASCLLAEADILPRLPDGVPHCRVLALASVGGWVMLALERLDGVMPGSPWTPEHLDAAYASCSALARLAPPASLTDRQWGAHFHRDDRHAADLRAIRDGTYRRPAAHGVDAYLDAVVARRGPELADLAEASRGVAGRSLLHNDLRPDNLLVGPGGRAYLLDWNWVCLGPPWVDFLELLPQAHRQGLDVRRWLDAPLLAGADDETADAVLAAIAVKMLGGQDEELAPGLPTTVWAHKLLHAHDAVRLLADRRGWHPPR
jgi:aminoglycoside phosphotransferase (APT) family kinase protein